MTVLTPATAQEVSEIVADCARASTPLRIEGQGSKAQLGRHWQGGATISLKSLTGITLYEPAELVLSAKAGTPLAEIHALLREQGQELAFEPMDYAHLLQGTAGSGTLGGLVACNLSGPRRIKAGAARDHMLGLTAVNGRGEIFKAGGRVVKNVTGYDLPRALTGSFGTLGIFTEITLKVTPAAEAEVTLIKEGLSDQVAIDLINSAMGTPADVSAAAHLPARAAVTLGFAKPMTFLRLEGFAASVADRAYRLEQMFGPFARESEASSRALWVHIRDGKALNPAPDRVVWRLSLTPSRAPDFVAALGQHIDLIAFYDWGGGLVWFSVPLVEDASASVIRAAVKAHGGGHATLISAPLAIRQTVAIFEPELGPLDALARRLKQQFDPANILEPGRMRPFRQG